MLGKNMLLRKIDRNLFLLLIALVLHSTSSSFVKIGPCLFPWKITCPDPHINFYLYTNKNRNDPQKVAPDTDAILKSHFNPRDNNKVIIHGFNSDMNLGQLLEMKEGYLTNGDYNVWMVDWSTVAAGPCYPVVVASLNYVGSCVAQFVHNVLNVTEERQKLFHVIGFSMGAHVAAFTANHLRPYKLPRITGLDPALPLFTSSNLDKKLDKTDALFVDVLHTDALVEGKAERCGHIDFYMNGGLEQPGCWNGKIIESFRCNHHRAPSYYAESITSKVGFWGWPCKSFFHYLIRKCPPQIPTVLMGEYCNQNATGYYIVHTAAESPFAIGKNYTHMNNAQILVSRESVSSNNSQIELITYPTLMDGIIEKLKANNFRSEMLPDGSDEYNIDEY